MVTDDSSDASSNELTRRRAIGIIGGATAVLLVDGVQADAAAHDVRTRLTRRELFGGSMQPAATPRAVTAAFSSPPVRTVRFVRAEDQLDVTIELFDVVLTGDQFSGTNGAVRLTFGSQHTSETAFQSAGAITPPTTAVDHMAAGNSQLVAPVNGTHDLSVAGILALIEQALTVQPAAGTADADTTILEVPAGLVLSPSAATVVTASPTPFTVGDTTELWLANLTDPSGDVELLAVENLVATDPTNAIPTSVDRDNLVTNTTAGPAISASELTLSSSGAFAQLEGSWPGATLIGYRQHIATGRDLSVEIESTGYIAPFGIRAAITTTTERIFTTDTANELTSAMRLERYLTILDPTIDLGGRDHQEDAGRRNLWTSITGTADETREVDITPVADGAGDIPGTTDITHLDDGSDLVIDYVAVDRNGDEVAFSLPATYITADEAHQTGPGSSSNRFAAVWNGPTRNARKDADLNGQRVAFADPLANGQTSKSAMSIRFDIDPPEVGAPGTYFGDNQIPAFNPAMNKASIVDEVLGDFQPFDVEFHPRWLDFGGGNANFDLSFLRLQAPKVGTIGGNLPTVSVAAIEIIGEVFNQTSGAGPDIPSINTPWDPLDFLGDGSKLLGSLLLSELADLKPPNLAVPGLDIPNTEIIVSATGVTIIYSFKPKLKTVNALGFIASPDTRCCVSITTDVPFDGEPEIVTETVVNDFTMVFPPGGVVEIIEIDFDEVKAIVASTGGLTVIPSISAWRLGEDLGFLQPIFDTLLNLGGLAVDVGSDFLDLNAAINLPTFNLGIVSLKNFHIDFSIGLPLQGAPVMLGTGVGSPSSPIEASVGFLGGTFYTTLGLEYHQTDIDWRVASGISLFAKVEFNAVVVSASVTVAFSLSFVFNKSDSGDSVKVVGAVSLEGAVNVLGVIDVSVKLVASLTYKSADETVTAKGTIHWGVDTALGAVEGKVPLGTKEYELGDGNSNNQLARSAGLASDSGEAAAAASLNASSTPRSSFGDLVSQADWTDYSNAFA